MVSLWHLLMICCFIAPLCTSIVVATGSHVGVWRLSVGAAVGICIGSFSAGLLWRTASVFDASLQRWSGRGEKIAMVLPHLMAIPWIAMSVGFADWITSMVLRIVF
jgi:hypothetical protein